MNPVALIWIAWVTVLGALLGEPLIGLFVGLSMSLLASVKDSLW